MFTNLFITLDACSIIYSNTSINKNNLNVNYLYERYNETSVNINKKYIHTITKQKKFKYEFD